VITWTVIGVPVSAVPLFVADVFALWELLLLLLLLLHAESAVAATTATALNDSVKRLFTGYLRRSPWPSTRCGADWPVT
jgi:hypothetical protein